MRRLISAALCFVLCGILYAETSALDLSSNIEYIDMPENIRNQYQYYTKSEIRKLRTAGYEKPITSLTDAVTDYVTNYLIEEKRLSPSDIIKTS